MPAPDPAQNSDLGKQWASRPLLALSLRTAVFLVPIGCAVLASELLARSVAVPAGPFGPVLWWICVSVGGIAVLTVAERLMRRLLPLAALLNVSLLFPDHAPRRFAIARQAGRPEQVLERLRHEGRSAEDGDLAAVQRVLELTTALSVHDKRTRGHSERVRVLTDMISAELRLPERDRARLRWGALLHDIGKLTVSVKILNKPDQPNPREWRVLRAHPEQGAVLLGPVINWLGVWGEAVVQHHEWFDGSGYPHGLKGQEIALGSRIVSVADVYETITAPRAYRLPVSVASARQELVRASGTQLDPVVVRAFLNVSAGRLWSVLGVGAALTQIPVLGELLSTVARVAPGLASTSAAAGAVGAMALTGGGVLAPIGTSQAPVAPHPSTTTAPTDLVAASGAGQPFHQRVTRTGPVTFLSHPSSTSPAPGPPAPLAKAPAAPPPGPPPAAPRSPGAKPAPPATPPTHPTPPATPPGQSKDPAAEPPGLNKGTTAGPPGLSKGTTAGAPGLNKAASSGSPGLVNSPAP